MIKNVVSGLIVAALLALISGLKIRFTRKLWTQTIRAFGGEPPKCDEVKCYAMPGLVFGGIRRKYPLEESDKKWWFWGRIQGRLFSALFGTRDRHYDSFGSWLMKLDGDYTWRGFYQINRAIGEAIPLSWHRSIPAEWERHKQEYEAEKILGERGLDSRP